jgi:hypothetical protein
MSDYHVWRRKRNWNMHHANGGHTLGDTSRQSLLISHCHIPICAAVIAAAMRTIRMSEEWRVRKPTAGVAGAGSAVASCCFPVLG